MAEVSQESVLRFLLQAGGRAKNSELLSRFKPLLDAPEPAQRATNREIFKTLVNGLAVVKDEGGVKYVVLRKKYLQMMGGRAGEGTGSPQTSNTCDSPPVRSIGRGSPATNTGLGLLVEEPEDALPAESLEEAHPAMSRRAWTRKPRERTGAQEEIQHPEDGLPLQRRKESLSKHGNSQESSSSRAIIPEEYLLRKSRGSGAEIGMPTANADAGGERRRSLGSLDEYPSLGSASPPAKADQQPRRRSLDLLEQIVDRAKIPPAGPRGGEGKEERINQAGDPDGHPSDTDDKRESVFALVAKIDTIPGHSQQMLFDANKKSGQHKEPFQKPFMLPLRCPPPPHITIIQDNDTPEVPVSQTETFLRNKEKFGLTLAPQAPPPKSPGLRRRQHDETGARSPHLKRMSKSLKVSEENKYSDNVPLEASEHDWLVKTTSGRWNHHLYGLLLNDSGLVGKKDFMSGFTALHWAAKSGNSEMLTTLLEIATKEHLKVDVNTKSYGGYTPLHIAAIHGRENIILKLVNHYRAKVHLRDWSGKKPHQYLHKTSSSAVRLLLDDPNLYGTAPGITLKRNSKVASSILGSTGTFLGVLSEDMAFHDLTKGFKKPASLNKLLFNAPSGPKKKPKTRGSFASFSSLHEEGEEDVEDVGVKRRPRSEFFPQ